MKKIVEAAHSLIKINKKLILTHRIVDLKYFFSFVKEKSEQFVVYLFVVFRNLSINSDRKPYIQSGHFIKIISSRILFGIKY